VSNGGKAAVTCAKRTQPVKDAQPREATQQKNKKVHFFALFLFFL
jgi:hypothetical protein